MPPPAASATPSCCSARRSCFVSPDGETVVFLSAEEFTSDAKEALLAMKPLKINQAVRITVARYIGIAPLFETNEEATIMPTASHKDRTRGV